MDLPALRGDGFNLRPFRSADADAVYAISQDPELRRFADLPDPYLPKHAHTFVEQTARRGVRLGQRAEFAIVHPATELLLGRVGIGLNSTRPGEGEIGYWLAPEARGRGLAAAAVRAACTWAFDELGLDVVFWRAGIGNEASRRVAERAGFTIDATLRHGAVHRGQRVDVWLGTALPGELDRLPLYADPPGAQAPDAQPPGVPSDGGTPEDAVLRYDECVGDDELNELFADSWPDHRPTAFNTELAWSLGWVTAWRAGRLVGFVNLAWDGGGHAFVLNTTVRPEVRRIGLGQRLVRSAIGLARNRGIAWLHVDYEEDLLSFYAGCGFRPTAAGLLRLA